MEQFAYRTHHSCEDLLSIVINDWQRGLDLGQLTGVLFIDVRKAFDSVDHQLLIQCLFDCGVCGKALAWFASYLEDRQQQVVVGTASSDFSPCQQGVPQGSMLGPYLFALYLKDLPSILKDSRVSVRLYADDICLYVRDKSVDVVVNELQNALSVVKDWLIARCLVINAAKSEFMVIRSKSFDLPDDICVRSGSVKLVPTATFAT